MPPLRARGAQRSPGRTSPVTPRLRRAWCPCSGRCHVKITLGKAVLALSRAWRASRAPGTDARPSSARTAGAEGQQRGVPGCALLHRGFVLTHSAGLASAGPRPGLGKRHGTAGFLKGSPRRSGSLSAGEQRSERRGPHPPVPCGPRWDGHCRRQRFPLAPVPRSRASAAGRRSSRSRHRQRHIIFSLGAAPLRQLRQSLQPVPRDFLVLGCGWLVALLTHPR